MRGRYKILLLLFLLISGAVFAGSQFEPVKAAARKVVYNLRFDTGLVGYWSFDGKDMSGVTATDRGSGGNNGTLTGGPTAVPGVVGQALNFDGSNDYVDGGTSSTLFSDTFTVTAWFRADAYGNGWTRILQQGTNSGGFGIEFDAGGAGNCSGTDQVYGVIWNGGTPTRVCPSSTTSLNTWHHVALAYNGATDVATLYVDGVEDGSASSAMTSPITVSFNIGRYPGSGNYFDGSIDEARVYNRALSAAEIAYQYARTKPAGSGTVAKSVANNNGLAGFWDFDDCDTCTTVTDRSGNGNTGTMYNAAGPTAGDLHTTGKVGKGANFDGSNDFVNIADSSSLQVTSTLTISAWIKRNVLDANYREIVRKGDRYFLLINSGNEIALGINNTSTYDIGCALSGTGKWEHVVAVYDDSMDSIYLYINGVSCLQVTTATSLTTTTGVLRIGSSEAGAQFFAGLIDEVRIYSRALSADEVKNLYNSTRKMFVNMPQNNLLTDGLVGFWSFNGPDMSGLTAYDRSGGGNNGTLTSGPTAVPGMVGQALNFDGSNDYMSAASNFDTTATKIITAAFWMYKDSFTNNDALGFESSTNFNFNDGAVLFDPNGGAPCSGFIQVVIQDSLDVTEYRNECFTRPSVMGWHHYAAVYDNSTATGDVKLFIDGVEQSPASMPSNTKDQSSTLGNYTWYFMSRAGSSLFNTGKLDEMRIYNRELTATEVLKLYNAGKR